MCGVMLTRWLFILIYKAGSTRQSYIPRTFWEVPEKYPDSRTSLGRIQDVNITIIHKMIFYGVFSVLSDFNNLSALHYQSNSKRRYVLFWSYYCPGCPDQNRIIRGRPQNVVCQLGLVNGLYESVETYHYWYTR